MRLASLHSVLFVAIDLCTLNTAALAGKSHHLRRPHLVARHSHSDRGGRIPHSAPAVESPKSHFSIRELLRQSRDRYDDASNAGFVRRSEADAVMNVGKDCWEPCGGKAGFCDFYCGRGNACCKKREGSDPEECYGTNHSDYTNEDVHECVAAPRAEDVPTKDMSIFIAIFTRRDAKRRRLVVRDLWERATRSGHDVVAKFVICDADDGLDSHLAHEQKEYGDILALECDEGYAQGRLTRKVIASMHAFVDRPELRKDLFYKTDDDTFLAWNRFSKFLKWRASKNVYMGVPTNQSVPCRNKSSRWYEPWSNYPKELFPIGFAGGPGYVIGKNLVDLILSSKIAEDNVLWNEDRAASVWIRKLADLGQPVDYVSVPGISGFWGWDWQNPTAQWGMWANYPHLVHHGLLAITISCLGKVDESGHAQGDVRHCFKHEAGQQYTPLRCAFENGDGLRKVEKLQKRGVFKAMPDDMLNLIEDEDGSFL